MEKAERRARRADRSESEKPGQRPPGSAVVVRPDVPAIQRARRHGEGRHPSPVTARVIILRRAGHVCKHAHDYEPRTGWACRVRILLVPEKSGFGFASLWHVDWDRSVCTILG